jgi:putative flippase GtrA
MKRGATSRFVLFAIVGTAGFIADVAVLYAAAPVLGWYGGRVLSFLAAATLTWQLNRRWTFADAAAARLEGTGAYLRYILTMLAGAVVNYAVYAATLGWVDGALAPALGVALGSIAGLAFNFAAAHLVLFPSAR